MMKNLLKILVIIAYLANTPITYCSNSYARILNSQTYIYKNASEDKNLKNIICLLEKTYYVEILMTYDQDFYKVRYNGVTGYVKRSEVKKVSGIPENAHPKNIEMVTINNNCYLRSSPEKRNDNEIIIIPSNCANLQYIGKVYGEQVDDFRDNTWYYVEYQGKYGYIYGEYLKHISNITPNVEQLNYVNTSDFDDIINPLSNGECMIIIFALLAPMLIILYLLFKKPTKKFKEKIVVVKEIDNKL